MTFSRSQIESPHYFDLEDSVISIPQVSPDRAIIPYQWFAMKTQILAWLRKYNKNWYPTLISRPYNGIMVSHIQILGPDPVELPKDIKFELQKFLNRISQNYCLVLEPESVAEYPSGRIADQIQMLEFPFPVLVTPYGLYINLEGYEEYSEIYNLVSKSLIPLFESEPAPRKGIVIQPEGDLDPSLVWNWIRI